MKTLILSIIFFLSNSILNAQPITSVKAWEQVYPLPTVENLNDVRFINDNTGFIVGNSGAFIRTNNSGANWIYKSVSDTSINTLEVIGNEIHVAGGKYGIHNRRLYFKSTNLGLSFTNLTSATILNSSDNESVITSIAFTDMNTGYISDINGKIYKTSNGGLSWFALNSGVNATINKIHFPETATGLTGYAIGGEGANSFALKTTDGGNTWNSLTIPPISEGHSPGAIDFIDPDFGFITGGGTTTPGAFALKTSDGGMSWTYIDISSLNTWIVNGLGGGVSVISEQLVYAAGEDGCIVRTTNSGIIWERLFPANNQRFPGVMINAISKGNTKLFCVGTGGMISEITGNSVNVKTGNPEVNLNNVALFDYQSVAIGNSLSINGIGDTIIFPVVFKGSILGGQFLRINLDNLSTKIYGCALNDNDIILCGDSGKVFKAPYWNANAFQLVNIGANPDEKLTSAYSIFQNNAFIAGNGRIFRTSDNMQNWFISNLQPGLVVNKISAYSGSDGSFFYGLSNNGKFIKSINGGIDWDIFNLPDSNFSNDVNFMSANIGWVCGKNGSVAKTTDGGISWQSVNIGANAENLTTVMFTLWGGGVIFSENGLTYSSIDNGSTWNSSFMITTQNVNRGVLTSPFRGLVITNHGGMIRYLSLEPRVESNGSEMAEIFQLHQNYPNPFNPVTKIKFTLPVNTNLTLKIFNSLGQEIETLIVNERMSSGSHTITWNASNFPSGVYFYNLITDDSQLTRKMILLK